MEPPETSAPAVPSPLHRVETFVNEGGATVVMFAPVSGDGWPIFNAPARFVARVQIGGPNGVTGTLDVPLIEAQSLAGAFALFDDRAAMEKLVSEHVQRLEAQRSRILRAGQQGSNGGAP